MSNLMNKHLGMLGLKVSDKVTGFTGVVASVSFDLYGCIQAIVNPGLQADGKLGEQCWFDINRLRILDPFPVMDRPNYDNGHIAEGNQGPAEKPLSTKV